MSVHSELKIRSAIYTISRVAITICTLTMLVALIDLYSKNETPNDGSENNLHMEFIVPCLILEIANIVTLITAGQNHAAIPSETSMELQIITNTKKNSTTTQEERKENRAPKPTELFQKISNNSFLLLADTALNFIIPIFAAFSAHKLEDKIATPLLLSLGLVYNAHKMKTMIRSYNRDKAFSALCCRNC